MRLLLDQNLPPRLIEALADLFPDSRHVRDVGLASVDDAVVWHYAAELGFTIVSKDADFHERSLTKPSLCSVVKPNRSTGSERTPKHRSWHSGK